MPSRARRLYGLARAHPRWLVAAAVLAAASLTAVVAARTVEANRRGTVVLDAKRHIAEGRHDAALALLLPLAARSPDPEVFALVRTARGDQTLEIRLPAPADGAELAILTFGGAAPGRTLRLLDRARVDLTPGDHLLTARFAGGLVSERQVTVERGVALADWTVSAPTEAARAPAGMAGVPAGVYEIGYDPPEGHGTFAHRRRRVEVRAFYIDVNEVTNEDYQRFLTATGHGRAPWETGRHPEGEARHPVTGVRWSEANAYAQWVGKRLPTETEWEVAGRGNDARKYSWGDAFLIDAPRANLGPPTQAGGLKPAARARAVAVDEPTDDVSPFGVRHLVGNVQEWVADPWLPREHGDPSAPAQEIETGRAPTCDRVVRGSSFEKEASSSRCLLAERRPTHGEATNERYGFRCALSAPH